MCLAEPYVVKEICGNIAKIDCNGKIVDADCYLTPEIQEGDYILLHDKLIVQKLDPQDAAETLQMIKDLNCHCLHYPDQPA